MWKNFYYRGFLPFNPGLAGKRRAGTSFVFNSAMTETDDAHTFHYEDGINGKKKVKHKKKGRFWKILLTIILLLVVIRLILPFVVLKYANKVLAKSKEYPGHVEDIDLALIRGAYVIKDIRIDKADTVTGKRDSIPFFTSPAIDLSVEWKALFKGKIVGEIALEEPRINLVKTAPKTATQKMTQPIFRM
jgi:hypothetical protein